MTSSQRDSKLAQAIVDYNRLKGEISELTRQRDDLKNLIANEMNRRGKDRLRTGSIAIVRTLVNAKRISRENLPQEVYDLYAVPNQYYKYTVKKVDV